MIERFEVGKYYRCVCQERPGYFSEFGGMDFLLNGKHKVISVSETKNCFVAFADSSSTHWSVNYNDFIEVRPYEAIDEIEELLDENK